MFKKVSLPVQLIAVIVGVFLFGHMLPVSAIKASYTFSVVFKELLGFILPFIIFSFVLTGILSFKKNAPLILAVVLGVICFSNAAVATITYLIARLVLPVVACKMDASQLVMEKQLLPYGAFSLPPLIKSEKALLLAIVLGIIFSIYRVPAFERAIKQLKKWVEQFVCTVFIPLLPLYVLGFLLKINYEGTFGSLMSNYGATFVLIVAVQVVVLLTYYWLAAGCSVAQAGRYIQNTLPSYLTAFSTMSSTATIPVTIQSAEKNVSSKPLVHMAIPIMANVHLLGDCVATPLLALVSMMLFKGCVASFGTFIVFIGYFCMTMLAASGIPGGGIIVMIPILISQLGFTSEMIGVITTLYLLLDSFGTAANVMGDGASVIVVDKLLKKLGVDSE